MRSDKRKATKGCMREVVRFAFWLVAGVVRRREEHVGENSLLRQQLIAAQRKIRGRVQWTPGERLTMGLAVKVGHFVDGDPIREPPRRLTSERDYS
jgi:hypothetical protein